MFIALITFCHFDIFMFYKLKHSVEGSYFDSTMTTFIVVVAVLKKFLENDWQQRSQAL
jgi:hypothetical protein